MSSGLDPLDRYFLLFVNAEKPVSRSNQHLPSSCRNFVGLPKNTWTQKWAGGGVDSGWEKERNGDDDDDDDDDGASPNFE